GEREVRGILRLREVAREEELRQADEARALARRLAHEPLGLRQILLAPLAHRHLHDGDAPRLLSLGLISHRSCRRSARRTRPGCACPRWAAARSRRSCAARTRSCAG